MRSQHEPFTMAENLIHAGAGNRSAHEPPAEKPPVTTERASRSRSTSDSGSLDTGARRRR
jgi:hypothetical protein